jgi:acetyl-CoA carboxylase biotin carboxyl carrier protein
MNVINMYKLNEIKELIKLVESTSIQQLEIENENGKLRIRKPEAPPAVLAQPAIHVTAPQPTQTPLPPTQAALPIAEASPPVATVSTTSAQEQASPELHKIVSPMVGTFYAAPSPAAAPFVNVGDHVKEKTVVCIVEAMKLMNEIEAEVSGQVVEVLAQNGQLVEFGQPLFLIKR